MRSKRPQTFYLDVNKKFLKVFKIDYQNFTKNVQNFKSDR
jgi:hypothetical protein